MSRSPDLAEVLRAAIDQRLAGVHVCMPGRIVSYDPATQTADVQPTIKNVLDVDEGVEVLAYPVIASVPIAHPRAGAWFVHLPLVAGDSVVLVFAERSMDEWRVRGGSAQIDPGDLRKHHLSDAIAIPGNLYPDAQALSSAAFGDGLSLGKSDGSTIHVKASGEVAIGSLNPTDAVATANNVMLRLNELKAAFLAVAVAPIGVAPPVVDPGTAIAVLAALQVAVTALLGTPVLFPQAVASTKVKVDA